MLHTLEQPPETSSPSRNGHSEAMTIVVNCAASRLSRHPRFRGWSSAIQLDFCEGTIILSGRLPSFYLKQLLQEALRDIDGVETIDNRVRVA